MDLGIIIAVINLVILGLMILALVYTFGIVWRVEKRLDISYKLFLLSIIFFLATEAVGFLNIDNLIYAELLEKFCKLLFAAFFLGGIWEMRKLVRKLDGEL